MKKITKQIWVSNSGKEFDNELDCELSEVTERLGEHIAENPLTFTRGDLCVEYDLTGFDETQKVRVTIQDFDDYFQGLPDQHIYAFANYFEALIRRFEGVNRSSGVEITK